MRAYYYDNIPGDQRLPHDYVPSRPVSLDTLKAIGVSYWTVPVDGYEEKIDQIAKDQDYKNRDTINVSKEGMGEASAALRRIVTVDVYLKVSPCC